MTYPHYLSGAKAIEYQLMSLPVAAMGAAFDSMSLFATLALIRLALRTDRNSIYLIVLSLDLIIAVLAGVWVLFAFVTSGWIVAWILANPETLSYRTGLYEGRFSNLFVDPFAANNLRNIFFGVVMGASALLPTLLHITLAVGAAAKALAGGVLPNHPERSA